MPLVSSFPYGTSCRTITFLPSQASAVLSLSKNLLLKSRQLYNEAFSLHSLWTMVAVTKSKGGQGRVNLKGFHKSLGSLHVLLTLTGYVEVLVIPAGARRIKVVEEKPAHSYLGNRCYRLTQELSTTPAPQFAKQLVCFQVHTWTSQKVSLLILSKYFPFSKAVQEQKQFGFLLRV